MNENKPDFLSFSVSWRGMLAAVGIVAFGIGVISCFTTVLGFLGKFSWYLDLFSHFRVQYMLGLGLLGLFLFLRGYRKVSGVFIVFAFINFGLVLPLYFGGRDVPESSGDPVRIMLLNVSTDHGDPERVGKLIQEIDPDILVLEEINIKWMRDLSELESSHPHSQVQEREDNFGIGLFSKFPVIDAGIIDIGGGVPSIVATVVTDQGQVRIIATHPLPPVNGEYTQGRNEQFERLPDHTHSSLPVILIGDLNATPWSYHFKKMLKKTGLIDSSRGRGVQATWPRNIPVLLIPLDHFLHSPDVYVVEKRIGANVGSDHYPMIVDFVIGAEKGISTRQPKSSRSIAPDSQ